MEVRIAESRLHQTPYVLYIAIDDLIPARGSVTPGLDEFAATLDHHGIPAVWVTTRTRFQMDEPRRKLGHTHPFIAEDGCGVFLPEDYFHLRPDFVLSTKKGRYDTPGALHLPAYCRTATSRLRRVGGVGRRDTSIDCSASQPSTTRVGAEPRPSPARSRFGAPARL